MNPHILDSNFFIQAHRTNYPFDVVPSFWNKIEELAKLELLISIDKVREEIFKNDDSLSLWCEQSLPEGFFKDSSVALNEYSTIIEWANSKADHYTVKAIQDFMETDAADAWLISFALNQNLPILSHEKSEPERKNRIKIPDVCIVFGVQYFNTVEMLRNLNVII